MFIPEIDDGNGNKYSNFNFFRKGGMGELYKGNEINSGKEVILKLVLIESTEEESLLKTEFDVVSKFSHKNIASALHVGKLQIGESNYLFYIQKYYPNGNLRDNTHKGISIDKCINMMMDILNGMKEIHTTIVHRDLKPENILVDDNGILLIADFGLSKYIDEKTRTRSFKGWGTIPYMAPECWAGDQNTTSMDIYSLGIIFYEIITGEKPYHATSDIEWRECHLFSPFPSILTSRKDVSVKLDQIIQKMSNKKIPQRYKNIDEIITALNETQTDISKSTSGVIQLAAIGNSIIQNRKAKELEISKETQKVNERIKFLNYEINELFNMVKDKIKLVNTQLEEDKITILEPQYNEMTTVRKLRISFNGKSVTFTFSNYDLVDKIDKDEKNRAIQFQRERYGMILNSHNDSYLKANNYTLIGLAETEYKIDDNEYGFNLLLKKDINSNYGEWYLLQIEQNCTPPKTKFGININNFDKALNEFQHHPFYTTTIREMKDTDIDVLLQMLMFM